MGTIYGKEQTQVQSITLDADEFITEISGRTGTTIVFITIKTNKGKTLACGGQGGNTVNNLLPADGIAHQIVGIGGAMSGQVHNLYLYYIN